MESKLPFLKNGIAQIAIIVEDLDQAVQQYWKVFGIGPWYIYTYGPPLVKTMSYRGQPTEYSMRIGLSYFGQMRVELIEPLTDNTVYADYVRQHGYGVHHFGILVDDMREALAEASQAGLAMTMDGAGFGRDGDGHFAYLDTEKLIGVTLELIDRPQGRMKPESVYPPDCEDE